MPNTDGPPEGGFYDDVTFGWMIRPPGRKAYVRLSTAHTVTTHDDGTITVVPSLIYGTQDRDDYWHGWLEHGVFREC